LCQKAASKLYWKAAYMDGISQMKIIDCVQGTPEWAAARIGIPTASEFSRLVTSTGAASKSLSGYANELAAELFAGQTLDAFEGNVWMNRGKDMEAAAVDLYAFTTDADVQRVGFVTNDAGLAGCSPDALVGDDGGLEIKCLKAERHIAARLYYQKYGKAPTDYIQQVQGSLLITGRAWWDLSFFHPELPPLTIRHFPDKEMHGALIKGIADVLAERDAALASMRHKQTHIPDATEGTAS
jgi:hypothetical protein